MSNVIKEVAEYLEDNGIGTLGTDLGYSWAPDDDLDVQVTVLDTGGVEPDRELPLSDPTFQIFIRSKDYDTGKTKLDAIRALLHQKTNVELVANGIYFYYIFLQAEGGHIGRNDAGDDEFSMNFICKHR